VVDRYVDDLACTFGIPRSQLNVVRSFRRSLLSKLTLIAQTAAAKGLVAGGFIISRQDGYEIDGMKDKEV